MRVTCYTQCARLQQRTLRFVRPPIHCGMMQMRLLANRKRCRSKRHANLEIEQCDSHL